jgi:hypothetical protein
MPVGSSHKLSRVRDGDGQTCPEQAQPQCVVPD